VTAPESSPRALRVGLISLGCAKNLVDAELMLGNLLQEGVEITNDPAEADAVIVNTCSFIDAAQEESIDTILESAAVREARHRGQALIVSGCLPQRFRDDLPKLLPEVDAFMGIDQVTGVGSLVRKALAQRAARLQSAPPDRERTPSQTRRGKGRISRELAKLDRAKVPPEPPAAPAAAPILEVHARPTFIPDFATPRFRLTPRHFAYLKIAEGCNHPCSFCIIPRMRGSHRSRPPGDLVTEARRLLAEGVKELNLISQDSTYYGLDLRPNHTRDIASPGRFRAAAEALPADAPTLARLLRELNDLPGEFWIRLLYTHPAHWTDELIRTIAQCPKVARYVDMPLQHIHPVMLQRMRRETSREHIEDLVRRIRAGVPGIALRTTFIVGFPGETAAMFDSLVEFIQTTRFERLGVFTYSREDATIAGRMAGQVPGSRRRRRREQAMAAQHVIARELSAAAVGREFTVLTEGPANTQQLRAANVFNWEHGFIREDAPAARLGSRRYTVGRSEADAPDIDGRVYVRGRLPAGEFVRVRVIGHTDYDLIAEAL
jgi:ribosomal protein S12 methylthiotransferase